MEILIPKIEKITTVEIPLPTADIPYYKPMVVPPSDLRDQEDEPVKTVEETPEPPTLKIPFIKQPVPQPSAEVVVAAVTTAVTAVASTTLTQPLIENIRKKAQKFLQGKINKWKQNRQKKKGLLTKLKENVDDHDEQMQVLGAAVRLGVVIWSGFIITLSYVELPMVKKSATAGDITFVASIFTGALATFGLSTGNGKKTDKKEPTKPR